MGDATLPEAAEQLALKNGCTLPVYRVAAYGGGWYWQCKSPVGVYNFRLPEPSLVPESESVTK